MSPRQDKILLIEGKRSSLESLLPALQSHWTTFVAYTGTAALNLGKKSPPQLIVFDAATMRSNGERNCRRIRKAMPDVPFVHVRAPEAEQPDIEADVFLQRPFTTRKLHNRIRALLPADGTLEQIVRLGHLTLYLGKRSIEVAGQGEHSVTPKVARLIEEFLRHPNEILSRQQLMERVWQTSYIGDTRTLDVHVRWIREIIEPEPHDPQVLATVRGIGYIWQWPTPNDVPQALAHQPSLSSTTTTHPSN
ncbi:MAG: response regulator transcription factor [Anaerolineales bacterium]|nr:response regulator transcription factor [Anaerolineales bacterium]